MSYLCKIKYHLIITVFIYGFTVQSLSAQSSDIRFAVYTGYNSYNLEEVREFERQLSSWFPLQLLEPVETLPNFYSYGLSITYKRVLKILGVNYSFHSTGSRYHYSDYSGETGFDTILKANFLGVIGAYKLFTVGENIFNVYGGFSPKFTWGVYDISQYLHSWDFSSEETSEFTTRGLNTEMFIKSEKELGPIIIFLKSGYDFTLLSRVYYEGERDFLIGGPDDKSFVDFSGFRINFGLGLNIGYWQN